MWRAPACESAIPHPKDQMIISMGARPGPEACPAPPSVGVGRLGEFHLSFQARSASPSQPVLPVPRVTAGGGIGAHRNEAQLDRTYTPTAVHRPPEDTANPARLPDTS